MQGLSAVPNRPLGGARMPNRPLGGALYLAWSAPPTGRAAAIKRRLMRGQKHELYRLRSWVIVNREARALITPKGPLDKIVDELWKGAVQPLESRWITSQACASESREIERVPVRLGLSRRPGEWPLSSAAAE